MVMMTSFFVSFVCSSSSSLLFLFSWRFQLELPSGNLAACAHAGMEGNVDQMRKGLTMASCSCALHTPTVVDHDAPQLSAPVSDRAPEVQMANDDIQQYHVTGISRASSLSTQHQALPVHVRTRWVSERVTDIIKQCLNAHGGSFDFSQIKQKNLRLSPSDERMYSRLYKLLQPGQLREFVDGHPEFEWHQKEPRGMVVTWADAAASAASAPGSASAAAPICDAMPQDDHFG